MLERGEVKIVRSYFILESENQELKKQIRELEVKYNMENELRKILRYVLAEYNDGMFCKNYHVDKYGKYYCILNLKDCKTCPICDLDLGFIKLSYKMI